MNKIKYLFALAVLALATQPAHAILNEFSVADGYSGAFSTRFWTYNPLWSFDGGTLNNNYVAQHGYNAGFALAEPFAMVVRNDNAAGNYLFSYSFEPGDIAGLNPTSVGSNILVLEFDVCVVTGQNSGTANNAPMMTMDFGGTRASPGMTIAFNDSNRLMWSDAAGNLNEFAGYTHNQSGWDRITLKLDFDADVYDLSITPLSPPTSPPILTGSSTYIPGATIPVVSGVSFTNALSDMQNLYFETFTDPEDGAGWHKLFLDNFDSMLMNGIVPEPGTVSLALCAVCFGLTARRTAHR
ncbi:MAG: hypothetical protein AAGD11_09335 [Planctomycetota bacterium]